MSTVNQLISNANESAHIKRCHESVAESLSLGREALKLNNSSVESHEERPVHLDWEAVCSQALVSSQGIIHRNMGNT
ncbi:hypothetical protein EYF80_001813 [Liparis tanakae]|uniref:Uncharacterized protein n=1 Tax=Liparis tanakae TaxID=230148 RepID=A0A4Z2JCA4_9TELE|nr:hypothetical protein EYF80_001813 [Liparis tanakae]